MNKWMPQLVGRALALIFAFALIIPNPVFGFRVSEPLEDPQRQSGLENTLRPSAGMEEWHGWKLTSVPALNNISSPGKETSLPDGSFLVLERSGPKRLLRIYPDRGWKIQILLSDVPEDGPISFNPASNSLAIAGIGSIMTAQLVPDGLVIHRHPHPGYEVAYKKGIIAHPDGRFIATKIKDLGQPDGPVLFTCDFLDPTTGKGREARNIGGSFVINPRGTWMAVSNADRISVMDLTDESMLEPDIPIGYFPKNMTVSRDGCWLAAIVDARGYKMAVAFVNMVTRTYGQIEFDGTDLVGPIVDPETGGFFIGKQKGGAYSPTYDLILVSPWQIPIHGVAQASQFPVVATNLKSPSSIIPLYDLLSLKEHSAIACLEDPEATGLFREEPPKRRVALVDLKDGERWNPPLDNFATAITKVLAHKTQYLIVSKETGLAVLERSRRAGLEEITSTRALTVPMAKLETNLNLYVQAGLLDEELLVILRSREGVQVQTFRLDEPLLEVNPETKERNVFVAAVPHDSPTEGQMRRFGSTVINLYGSNPANRPTTLTALATLIRAARQFDGLLRVEGISVDELNRSALLDLAS